MDVMEMTSQLILYLLLTAAVVSDFRFGKVSNRLILAGILAGFFFRLIRGGPGLFFTGLLNLFFPVILLFLFYLCGGIGAGDIKLFSMIGIFMNFTGLIRCIAASFLAGAVWSLGNMIRRGTLGKDLLHLADYARSLCTGKLSAYQPLSEDNKICFTAAIFIGTLLTKLVKG